MCMQAAAGARDCASKAVLGVGFGGAGLVATGSLLLLLFALPRSQLGQRPHSYRAWPSLCGSLASAPIMQVWLCESLASSLAGT